MKPCDEIKNERDVSRGNASSKSVVPVFINLSVGGGVTFFIQFITNMRAVATLRAHDSEKKLRRPCIKFEICRIVGAEADARRLHIEEIPRLIVDGGRDSQIDDDDSFLNPKVTQQPKKKNLFIVDDGG
jgi:hypothetical protein